MSNEATTYQRFDIAERVEHIILVLSFTTLALTGLPQRYALAPASIKIIGFLGGIQTARFIHHLAAYTLMVETLYHLIVVGYKAFVLRRESRMIPKIKDVLDAIQTLGYNLGIAKEKPKMPHFNFVEKVEYWALIWGLLIMGITGFMMWNPIATTNVLPGDFVPAAKTAHGYEAILAVLAIVIWHFYSVHIKGNWSIFTGTVSKKEMEEEHAEDLERIESGIKRKPATEKQIISRNLIYFPAAALFSVVFLGFVFYFLQFQKIAITTVLPPNPSLTPFSPWTPSPIPTLTPAPTLTPGPAATATPSGTQASPQPSALTWDSGIADLFKAKCVACHGTLGGLSLSTYQDAMLGGNTGPVILPGDPTGSTLVQIQEAGGHPGQFTPEELDKIKAWIAADAPEK